MSIAEKNKLDLDTYYIIYINTDITYLEIYFHLKHCLGFSFFSSEYYIKHLTKVITIEKFDFWFMRPYILKCIHFSNKKLLALFYIRAGHHTKLLISSSRSQHKTFKSMRTAILCCERVQIVSLQMIQKLYRILKCFKVKQLTQR